MLPSRLKTVLGSGLLVALMTPSTVLAYSGVTITPGSVDNALATTSAEKVVTNIAGSIINIVLFIAGAAAVIYLVWAGIKYISAGGDSKKAGEAKTAIMNAVIGLIVIVTTWTIISLAFSVGDTVKDVTQSEIFSP